MCLVIMSNPPSVRNLIGNMSTSSSDGNGIWVSVDHSIPNSASKEPPSSPRLIVVFDNIDSRYHDQVFNYDRRAGKKRKKKKKKQWRCIFLLGTCETYCIRDRHY